MKNETIIRIDAFLEKVDNAHVWIFAVIVTILVSPLLLIYCLWEYLEKKSKRKVYDQSTKEWLTKEEIEKDLLKDKIRNRELPLISTAHATPSMNDRFYFFEKRKYIIPYDKLVYVETEYTEEVHRFFEENAEWLEMWQRWHGLDIIHVDNEDIKEGMFYPQDFSVFRHGFLWHSPFSSGDRESGIIGNMHHYYDIDPDSDTPIKEQLDTIIRSVFDRISFAY